MWLVLCKEMNWNNNEKQIIWMAFELQGIPSFFAAYLGHMIKFFHQEHVSWSEP